MPSVVKKAAALALLVLATSVLSPSKAQASYFQGTVTSWGFMQTQWAGYPTAGYVSWRDDNTNAQGIMDWTPGSDPQHATASNSGIRLRDHITFTLFDWNGNPLATYGVYVTP